VTEQICFPGQLPATIPPGGELGAATQPLLPDAAVGVKRPEHHIAGESIQHGPLLTGPQQPQLIVLAVYREHAVSQVGQHPRRDRATTEVRAGATVCGERAAGDEAAVLVCPGTHLFRQVGSRAALGWPEATLHDGTVGAAADPGGVGSLTGEQVQAGHHHRFACSGLTGHHGQAGVQVQGGLVDHTEALYAHLGEHGPHPSVLRPLCRVGWVRQCRRGATRPAQRPQTRSRHQIRKVGPIQFQFSHASARASHCSASSCEIIRKIAYGFGIEISDNLRVP
jgi:hypothetical protein